VDVAGYDLRLFTVHNHSTFNNQSTKQPTHSLSTRSRSTWQRQRFWFGGRVRRSFIPVTYTIHSQPHIAL